MKRFVLSALIVFVTLLFGGAHADEVAVPEKAPAKDECKKAGGKCAKPKTKKKPLAKVEPSIKKDTNPPSLFTSPFMHFAVLAYQECMYDERHPEIDRVARAIALNLEYRNSGDLRGGPTKLGREVCLADVLGLRRYETQAEIDAAKGVELFEVSPEFILFPDDPKDKANRLPPERRFARMWVKEYVEALARDLHTHLLSRRAKGNKEDVPLLRVNSLVRALADQAEQASPAQCKNEICSSHLTGGVVDISNNPVFVSEESRTWIRARLFKDRKEGKIVMIQEFKRPHYHIFVIPPEFIATTQLNPPATKK